MKSQDIAFPVDRSPTLLASFRAELNLRHSAFAARAHDIDPDGRLYVGLLWFAITGLVIRVVYVLSLANLHGADPTAAQELVLAAFFIAGAMGAQRFRLQEAALLLRAGSIAAVSIPWSIPACVAVFHTGRNFPILDNWLAHADHLIGFDWIGYARWFDDRPWAWTCSHVAYRAVLVQSPFICALLAFSRSAHRLYAYICAQIICLHAVAVVAIFVPALGAYVQSGAAHAGFHHTDFITADNMTTSILWMRREAMSFSGVEVFTLISFPSFHACCAVVFAWALWRTPYIRWLGVGLNLAMIAATPVQGSHYLVDVFAGAIIAVLAIIAANALLRCFDSSAVHPTALIPDLPKSRTG